MEYAHVLKDSRELSKRVRQVNASNNDVLLKVDIEDFYMSGTCKELAFDTLHIKDENGQQAHYTKLWRKR